MRSLVPAHPRCALPGAVLPRSHAARHLGYSPAHAYPLPPTRAFRGSRRHFGLGCQPGRGADCDSAFCRRATAGRRRFRLVGGARRADERERHRTLSVSRPRNGARSGGSCCRTRRCGPLSRRTAHRAGAGWHRDAGPRTGDRLVAGSDVGSLWPVVSAGHVRGLPLAW